MSDDRVPIAVDGEITQEAMAYTFTEHAMMRMAYRQITRADAYRVISAKDRIERPSKDNPRTKVLILGEYVIAIDPGLKRVVTVWNRAEFERQEGKVTASA